MLCPYLQCSLSRFIAPFSTASEAQIAAAAATPHHNAGNTQGRPQYFSHQRQNQAFTLKRSKERGQSARSGHSRSTDASCHSCHPCLQAHLEPPWEQDPIAFVWVLLMPFPLEVLSLGATEDCRCWLRALWCHRKALYSCH